MTTCVYGTAKGRPCEWQLPDTGQQQWVRAAQQTSQRDHKTQPGCEQMVAVRRYRKTAINGAVVEIANKSRQFLTRLFVSLNTDRQTVTLHVERTHTHTTETLHVEHTHTTVTLHVEHTQP